jgi:hypothetical protein
MVVVFVCIPALTPYVVRTEQVLLAGESLVKVSHRIHIERHNPVICVNEVLVHPVVDVFGLDSELDHEAEEHESVDVVRVSVGPYFDQYFFYIGNLIQLLFEVLIVLCIPHLT